MNAKETILVDFIKREGYGDSRWGTCNNAGGSTLAVLFGTEDESDPAGTLVPPERFIYLWVNEVEAEQTLSKLGEQAKPDIEYCPIEGEIVLIWDISQVS